MDFDSVFSDVIPIPQDDGPHPVAAIAYTEEFTQAMDYMRAILRKDEKSQRALELTAVCLKLNPANYTLWQYRREILAEIGGNATKDLQLATSLGGSNPKNYQIWYHRRAMLANLDINIAKGELQYVASVLEQDGKNYHAWSHRQWIVRTLNDDSLWEEEIEFSSALILQDCRNNSAWNHRWFAVHRGKHAPVAFEVGCKEASFALKSAALDPYNESPLRYLIAVVKEQCKTSDQSCAMELVTEMEKGIMKLRENPDSAEENNVSNCVPLTTAYIDILEVKHDSESSRMAAEIANDLAEKYDTVRAKYWRLRVQQLLPSNE